MSKWTHQLCGRCYGELEPGRTPTQMKDGDIGVCCRCGQMTDEGIFYRADPMKMLCEGKHD